MSKPIITRFAPSPTGFLHIGGARTALFNWVFAKHMGGKMLLRIEDTDLQRSTPEAVEAILTGLKWLGIDWSGEAVSQHQRQERHIEIANELVAQGKAYYCYTSRDEITKAREEALLQGLSTRYNSPWRENKSSHKLPNVDPVVRMKAPLTGETIINDLVQGKISFPNKDLDDFIILRADGTPTYMHAVVVDDHDMQVTHIIRGDDHLTNAARQAIIYDAMGWDMPVIAHIPLIHGADGAKLSKRHGALGVNDYKDMGYLPTAMINYLMRLGWSHGNDEIMSREQIIEWFEIHDVNKSAAKMDFQKLNAINGYYIKNSTDNDLLSLVIDRLSDETIITATQKEQLKRAMPILKDRSKTIVELSNEAAFIFKQRPISLDEKSVTLLNAENKVLLKALLPLLIACTDWTKDHLTLLVQKFSENNQLKLAEIAQPLRAAITGQTKAPGIFQLLTILPKDEVIARLKDQL